MTDTAPPYISNRPPRPVRPKPVRVENTRLLREIGRVIRSERAKRGMTRKILAKQSGMSERFVAQIELGEGNPSVLSLDALARALNVDLFDLLPAVDPAVFGRAVAGNERPPTSPPALDRFGGRAPPLL